MDIQCPHCESYLNIREIYSRCTECKELFNQKPQTMKKNFKESDKVFVYPYGWCILIGIYIDEYWQIRHNEQAIEVHKDLVSFTEYTLQGFTQERPFEPVIGKMYFFWDDAMLDAHRVCCSFYKGFGSEAYPYLDKGGSKFQHISETNPLL